MIFTRCPRLFLSIAGLACSLALFVLPAQAHDPGPRLKHVKHAELLRLGERMYRDGILPNGEPINAVVKGDVPVEGTMFSCVSCHLRSGFGSDEGQVRTPPVDGTRLYSPVLKARGAPLVSRNSDTREKLYRPAYTDETLGRVIETGIDPAGRQLDSIMPIYFLTERDRDILVYYLKNLSTAVQPGVTETEIRFATVITAEVSSEDRDAMLVPLQNYIRNYRLPRSMERGMRSSVFRREGIMRALRKPVLSVWELSGPPRTWRKQLEEHYRKEPVFAFLGGISTGEWEPVHRFCEENRIPAIYPITDHPVISETDWYTLYLSKGPYQEGEAVARFLHQNEEAESLSLLEVLRDEPAGRSLSEGFGRTWESLGRKQPRRVIIKPGTAVPADLLKNFEGKGGKTVLLLWLHESDFSDIRVLARDQQMPSKIFASAPLLGERLYELHESERPYFYFTHPTALPQDAGKSLVRANTAPVKKRSGSSGETGLKMHSLVKTVSGPLNQMRSFVSRDNFLEMIESTIDLTERPSAYPRLSFGPGQRYASKGCYIVQLSEGTDPQLIKKSDWVIH